MALLLRCPSVDDAGVLDARHTCRGRGTSPPLAWEDVPAEAVTLALLLRNLDAPLEPAVHWLVFNIPAQADELLEGADPDLILDGGAKHGLNASRRPGYLPPCPAPGAAERFLFSLLALDRTLKAGAGARLEQIAAPLSAPLAQAELACTVRIE